MCMFFLHSSKRQLTCSPPPHNMTCSYHNVPRSHHNMPCHTHIINLLQYLANGNVVQQNGLSLLVDNGYLKFKQLQCPHKIYFSTATKEWAQMAESLRYLLFLRFFMLSLSCSIYINICSLYRRKDVECFFGILKIRFAIIRYGIRFHDALIFDNIFKVFFCCRFNSVRFFVTYYISANFFMHTIWHNGLFQTIKNRVAGNKIIINKIV